MGWISILYFFMWFFLTVLVLLLLILILPVNLNIKGVEGKYEVKIKLWFLDINKLSHMFVGHDKKENKPKSKDSKNKRGEFKKIIKYSKLVLANANKILRMTIKNINFKKLNLKLRIGGEDASKVAVEYGEICSVFYPLARVFVNINRPKQYSLSVVPDFLSDNIKADMDIHLKARILNFVIILINIIRIMKTNTK